MSKKIKTLLFFFLAFSFVINAQTDFDKKLISRKTNSIVKQLEKFDKVTGPHIGKAALKSDQYILFEKLKKQASDQELFQLTNYTNPIVRAYAFYGLCDKNSSLVMDVISKNQYDTALVKQQFGCIGSTNTVIGFMMELLDDYLEKNEIVLTTEQETLIENIEARQDEWYDRKLEKDMERNKNK